MTPFHRRRHRRRVARLHAGIERQQRSIDAIEAATTEDEIDAALALRDRHRRRRALVALASFALIAGAAAGAALLLMHDHGAKAARPALPAQARTASCPAFEPPAPGDVPIGKVWKFEDGGMLAHSFFSLYHPRGFSAAPVYTQHYELYRTTNRLVRIRIGTRWRVDEADPRRYLAAARDALRRSETVKDLGTQAAVLGCQRTIRWDYERTVGGERLRARRYFFVTSSRTQGHAAYDVLFEAPAKTYDDERPAFALVERSFRVNPGMVDEAPATAG